MKHYGFGIVDKYGESHDDVGTCEQTLKGIADYRNNFHGTIYAESRPFRVVELFYKEAD